MHNNWMPRGTDYLCLHVATDAASLIATCRPPDVEPTRLQKYICRENTNSKAISRSTVDQHY